MPRRQQSGLRFGVESATITQRQALRILALAQVTVDDSTIGEQVREQSTR